MANSTSHAALPYPIKNARFTLLVPYLDADGDPTDPTTPDTEFSGDAGAFADCAEEVSTISGSNGTGYITLTGAETNYSMLALAAKVASGPKNTLATLYPRNLASIGTGTLSAGSAGGGTLGTILAYDVTNCFIMTTGGTGGGGTGGANNQARRIATYTTSTGAFTVTPNWETTPDNTTTYSLLLPEGVTLGMLRTLNPATAGRTLLVGTSGQADANVTQLLGTNWLTPGTAGTPDVNMKLVGGQTASASGTVTFPNGTLASTTNISAGTITTTTNLTNLPAITANWLTGTGIDATAVTKIQNGLSTLTQAQVTGGAYALNSASFAFNAGLDFTTTQKAATLATVTNLTNAPTNGDFTTAMKASINTEADTALSDIGATSARMGYLVNLNIGGNVASSTEVTAIQNNTRVVRVVPDTIERPDSGTTTYRVELFLYDETGNMEAPDSAPTVALVNQGGTNRASRLDSTTMALVETGRYRCIYTADVSDTLEQLVWTFSVTEGGATRKYGNQSLIVDTTAVDFTAADRLKLEAAYNVVTDSGYGNEAIKNYVDDVGVAGAGLTAVPWNAAWNANVLASLGMGTNNMDTQLNNIYTTAGLVANKLPSKAYLTGTSNSDGDVQLDEASGVTFPTNFELLEIDGDGNANSNLTQIAHYAVQVDTGGAGIITFLSNATVLTVGTTVPANITQVAGENISSDGNGNLYVYADKYYDSGTDNFEDFPSGFKNNVSQTGDNFALLGTSENGDTFGEALDVAISEANSAHNIVADATSGNPALYTLLTTTGIKVGTNADKTGYSLTVAPPTTAEINTALGTAHGSGSWATATGFATPTNVSDAVTALAAYGDNHWTTATGFAVAGSAMTLTSGERNNIATALLDLTDGIETGITLRKLGRAVGAMLAGLITNASGTFTVKALGAAADGTTRLTIETDDNQNRTEVTLNL